MPDADRLEIAPPVVGVQLGWRTLSLLTLSSIFGLFSLAWPLFFPAINITPQHTQDAPFILAALLPMILLLTLAQLSDGGLDSKSLAMLGVLSAINAVLRPTLGTGTAGVESIYFLLILAGRAYGPGFGFLLGNTSMFASALLTAGIGPWLPFQMMCCGWIGLAAGFLPKKLRGRLEIAFLTLLGIVSAYLYGLLMNLWFWPFITGSTVPGLSVGALDYVPGASFSQNFGSFLRFTLLSSTGGWDTGRAITTALAILFLGPPILVVLRRTSTMARISAAARSL